MQFSFESQFSIDYKNAPTTHTSASLQQASSVDANDAVDLEAAISPGMQFEYEGLSDQQCPALSEPALVALSLAFDSEFSDRAAVLSEDGCSAAVPDGGPFWASLRCKPAIPETQAGEELVGGPWIARFAITAQARDGPGSMFGVCCGAHNARTKRAFGSRLAWMLCSRTGARWHAGEGELFAPWAATVGDVVVSLASPCPKYLFSAAANYQRGWLADRADLGRHRLGGDGDICALTSHSFLHLI